MGITKKFSVSLCPTLVIFLAISLNYSTGQILNDQINFSSSAPLRQNPPFSQQDPPQFQPQSSSPTFQPSQSSAVQFQPQSSTSSQLPPQNQPQNTPQLPNRNDGGQQQYQPSQVHQEGLAQVTYGAERFALELFKRISIEVEPHKYDIIMSPFSVWALLVLTSEGAAGNTLTELQTVLGLPTNFAYVRKGYQQITRALNVNTSSSEISTTQVLFSDKNRPVDPEFEERIERDYKATLFPVDFHNIGETARTINDFISNSTHGRIQKLARVDDLLDATMVLASAIFFKGQWKSPFNYTYTREEPFYDEDGNVVGTANMMFQRGAFPYTAIADLDSHILELPYGQDNRLSMIILLPRKGVTLTTVVEKLAATRLQRVYDELRKAEAEFEDDEVEVHLPRFAITTDFSLTLILEKMGLLDIFSATEANLTKISKFAFFLSRIFHKARIEVNEEGTVATAATGGVFANKATPPRFYANRPFAYLIVDKVSNVLLFCGQVKNPDKFRF